MHCTGLAEGDVMARSRRLMTGAAFVGCALALAACGGPTGSPAAASSTPTPTPTPTPATSAAAPTSHPPMPTPVTIPLCTRDIRVIPGTAQGAAGHLALVLVFNNVSRTRTCEISGYPGVDLVNASGVTVAHLKRTLRGMAGGEPAGITAPQPVFLAPGASASALAEASDVPHGAATSCGSYSLMVTVPDQHVAVPAGTAMLPRCSAEIHPIVAGTGGGMH
jgi:hypothetical protein